ncbi:MAG: thermonuclease family protein [Desulfamplus sp.]|nr:thermonuclease family protein [Desulfamplus sp.]
MELKRQERSSLVLFDIFSVLFRNYTSIIEGKPVLLLLRNFNPAVIAAMLIIVLSWISTGLCGDIFFWTDEHGVPHYSNVRPSSSAKEVQTYTEKNGNELPYENRKEATQSKNSETQQDTTSFSTKKNNKTGLNTELSRKDIDDKLNISFKVLKIYDGDSIKIDGAGMTLMVRLVGIDAPESGGTKKGGSRKKKGLFSGAIDYWQGQPFSSDAKNALTRMVDKRDIYIRSYGTDSYNRILAEVFTKDGTLVNLEMVRQGMAEIYRGSPPDNLDIAIYKKAEKEAKRAYRGIWSLGANYESPKEWRKRNPRK